MNFSIMPSLLDPATCGEDIARMASRMTEIAPALCSDCADYHIRFAVTRYVSPKKGIAMDRPYIIRHLQQILADRTRRSGDMIEIVIAGSSDTGLLATCAHAACVLGSDFQSRCRFIVLDRCKSPLALCTEFAKAHRLDVKVAQTDLLDSSVRFDADVIIVHSFLRFIDRDQQTGLLRRFETWLKPQGRLIISQALRSGDRNHLDWEESRSKNWLALAKAAVASGALTITDDAALLLEKMSDANKVYQEQPGEVASADELRDLLLSAGLREYSLEVMGQERPVGTGSAIQRVRALAVFCSSRDN